MLDLALGDPNAPVEGFGFHAQQAAEKLVKAAIKAARGEYPLTHNLDELLDIARDVGADVPDRFEGIRALTPFAARFRCDVYPTGPAQRFDRDECRALIRDLRGWVEAFLASRNWSEPGP